MGVHQQHAVHFLLVPVWVPAGVRPAMAVQLHILINCSKILCRRRGEEGGSQQPNGMCVAAAVLARLADLSCIRRGL